MITGLEELFGSWKMNRSSAKLGQNGQKCAIKRSGLDCGGNLIKSSMNSTDYSEKKSLNMQLLLKNLTKSTKNQQSSLQ
jgi:hypothetical protein